jgi:ABC-2 type transport system permease protein
MLLSGFMFPIENMPPFIQFITHFIPLKYFLSIVRALFLKGVGIQYLWPDIWPMFIIGVALLVISIYRFRSKLE